MDELIDGIFTKGNEWYVIIAAFILGALYTLLKIGFRKLFKRNIKNPAKRPAK
ncbi:MAG: hypothetical protein P1P88_26285 [Bacteroidales bacterium]|nr:hypothetical protein [Bacteroidales bacterium]